MPVITTARPALSEKSSPSLTFPLQSAKGIQGLERHFRSWNYLKVLGKSRRLPADSKEDCPVCRRVVKLGFKIVCCLRKQRTLLQCMESCIRPADLLKSLGSDLFSLLRLHLAVFYQSANEFVGNSLQVTRGKKMSTKFSQTTECMSQPRAREAALIIAVL